MVSSTFWVIFAVFILGAVSFDLYFLEKRQKELSLKQATYWTLAWISLAFLFGILIYHFIAPDKALEYFTAYLVEESLSFDNLFVFLLIFSYFGLPAFSQRKVLKIGILSAFLMRAAFIFGGIWVLTKFHFLIYIFGGFLIYSGIKLFLQKGERKVDPNKSLFLRAVKKIARVTTDNVESFFEKKGGLVLTPLFLALILIETSDVVFAMDSIPAVLSISQDPFIAYTSNAFAVLGLRALYFFLIGFLEKFFYLKKAVIILLVFAGFKMALQDIYPISVVFSLIFILAVLIFSILLSVMKERKANISK